MLRIIAGLVSTDRPSPDAHRRRHFRDDVADVLDKPGELGLLAGVYVVP
jgi:hypothetical protein